MRIPAPKCIATREDFTLHKCSWMLFDAFKGRWGYLRGEHLWGPTYYYVMSLTLDCPHASGAFNWHSKPALSYGKIILHKLNYNWWMVKFLRFFPPISIKLTPFFSQLNYATNFTTHTNKLIESCCTIQRNLS